MALIDDGCFAITAFGQTKFEHLVRLRTGHVYRRFGHVKGM